MKKNNILALTNLFFAIWFLYLWLSSLSSLGPTTSLYLALRNYSPSVLLILLFLSSLYLAYRLFRKKYSSDSFILYLILTFCAFFYFSLFFLGSFFASHLLFPLISLMLTIFLFLKIRIFSQKIAWMVTLGTIMALLIVLFSSFEEDYCLNQGMLADPSGVNYTSATSKDAYLLKKLNVYPNMQINKSYRAHMLCHVNFSLPDALRETVTTLRW